MHIWFKHGAEVCDKVHGKKFVINCTIVAKIPEKKKHIQKYLTTAVTKVKSQ